jgi:precorrin-6B methylase 2
LFGFINRMTSAVLHSSLNSGQYFFSDLHKIGAGASLAERFGDIEKVSDFRPTDQVLDMGCAEGLIALQVADRVAQVHGVEIEQYRVDRARQEAMQRKTSNATFEAGSVVNYPLAPKSYDVVLFLGVLGKRTESGQIGSKELERMLEATRRQIIVRVKIQEYTDREPKLKEIIDLMEKSGFDAICFSRRKGHGNLIVGNRRGTDARLRTVPPLVLVPTECMRDHPCLHGAQIGSYADFA